MSTLPEITTSVRISPRAASSLKRGGSWIFSNEIIGTFAGFEPGTWCWFESPGGFAGTGYINPRSLIAGRIFSQQKVTNTSELLRRRLDEAIRRRETSRFAEAVRLVFSEGDFLPGLVVDWFSEALVIQINTAGMERAIPFLLEQLPPLIAAHAKRPSTRIVLRCDAAIRTLEDLPAYVRVERGIEAELRRWPFQESGLWLIADLIEGQKTGFFIDQRDNRDFLESWLTHRPGAAVLDLFCYSGAWGFRALKQKADHVVFVDQSESALALVEAGLKRNSFEDGRATRIASDAFDYLSHVTALFDVIVADPPAFAKSKKSLPQARKAYEKLVRLSWKRIKPGGLLVVSSCSYHVSEPDFLEMVRDAVGREEGNARVVYRGRQGADHPILLGMPETAYLKCIGLQKIA